MIVIIFQALLGMWTVTLKLHPVIVSLHFLGGLTLLGLLTSVKAHQHWDRLDTPSLPIGLSHAIHLLIIIYILQVMLGAWVSTNYAGLSCSSTLLTCSQARSWSDLSLMLNKTWMIWSSPDPLAWYSPSGKAWIQVLHRYNALILGASLLYVRAQIWQRSRTIMTLGGFIDLALVLYGIQVLIGMILIWTSLPLWAAVCHNIVAALMSLPLIFLWTYTLHKAKTETT